jgi:thymidylate synthase (FAD)
MKLIKPSYEILSTIDGNQILKDIELAGRTCYKSEDKITEDSAQQFVRMILGKAHESVIEHKSVTVKFICDRGVSHEIVRHRLASFSQESTRYCNYSKDKFGNELTFIIPCWLTIPEIVIEDKQVYNVDVTDGGLEYISLLAKAQETYFQLLSIGWQPQQARAVLPNSLKTEIVVTANLREWRTIFKQRTSQAAHPQMRELMVPLLAEFKTKIPVIFDDITT